MRPGADASWRAACQVADLLLGLGRVEELRARADAGDRHAAERLAEALERAGQVEEVGRLRRFGLSVDE